MPTSQHSWQPSRRGFTLIELMIAIGLAIMIIYAATAGVRMANQSITIANRMAIENTMMRAGYYIAVDEADTWRHYDDPDDTGNADASFDNTRPGQRLRAFMDGIPYRRGLAFTPFDGRSMPRNAASPGGGGPPRPSSNEAETGWDASYSWPASDSRTWFHGNLVEEIYNTKHLFGDYGMFSHFKTAPRLLAHNGVGVDYGTASPLHHWQCTQLEGLKNALGYYGVCEYMPANTIYGVNGEPGGDNLFGSGDDIDNQLEAEWAAPSGSGGGTPWRFSDDDGGTQWARGLYRNTRDATYPLVPAAQEPTVELDPLSPNFGKVAYDELTAVRNGNYGLAELVLRNFRSCATDRVGDALYPNDYDPHANGTLSPPRDGGAHGLHDLVDRHQLVMPVFLGTAADPGRPQNWPDLKIRVMRYINNCRFVTLLRIDVISALDGHICELNFALTSTSLRGARQQRKPGGGWAQPGLWQYWNNPGDANLDSP
jgi:prepilin-type N-terminal cleavage/methylation domain-containing protein